MSSVAEEESPEEDRAGEESTGESNPHAAWRMAVAQRAADAYTENPKLAALTVAGSVGAGLADRFSDLELDCYWSQAPTDQDRRNPVQILGGKLIALWDYDTDEEEWSEDYQLGELDVTVSNFVTGTIDRWLDGVTRHADSDPVKHMRLAAIQRSQPLAGQALIESWQDRAASYPDRLVEIMVGHALDPTVLRGWSAREALVSRGDDLAVQDLLSRIGFAAAQAVLALNRVYLPHRQFKWQRHLLAGLDLAPDAFTARLDQLTSAPPAQALPTAEQLLADTVQLAEARTDADLTAFRQELAEKRRALDPPEGYGQST